MSLQSVLSNDRARGPGHGLLRLGGTRLEPGPLAFSLMRNQGTAPFLGHGGQWQATEVWHVGEARAGEGADEVLMLPLGPELVDPIVALPTTVAFRLTLQADDGVKQASTLKVVRPLLGSSAAAPPTLPLPELASPKEPPPQPEPVVDPRGDTAEALRVPLVDIPAAPVPSPKALRPWIQAGVLLLALAGGGLYTYLQCLIPTFGPARCQAPPVPLAPEVITAPPTLPESVPSPSSAPAPAPTKSCANLAAVACLALADGALAAREMERARQLYQDAARLGSLSANVRLARMYDPEGWSAEQSPVAQPDWDTAAYWYEEAARGGDQTGREGAGRLLCRFGTSDFERGRGLQLLREAAQQGAQVQALIQTCGGKP